MAYSFKDIELIQKFNNTVPDGQRSALIENFIENYLYKKRSGNSAISRLKDKKQSKVTKLGVS